ncbi:transposase [Nitrosovibrio sp. Nv17]
MCRQLGVSEATFYTWKKKSQSWASASSAGSSRSRST